MSQINHNVTNAEQRRRRVRGKIRGTSKRPRVSVFRSNQYTYLQAIDDQQGVTVAAANELSHKNEGGTKTERATQSAQELATQLQQKKVKQVVFDRGSYRYHGRVKAVAEALREAGIEL